jgi:hypothetical protein
MQRTIVLAACLCALAGCSSHKADDAATQAAANAPVEPAKQKTVFDDQLKALEKAKAVQKSVDDAAKAEAKKIDDAGG